MEAMLSVGIVGLPNVGKSTLFNALTCGSSSVSNYPFTTIDSSPGVVAVPDPRLEELRQWLKPRSCTPSFVQFIDIAGLVQGASRGEGLGNQFLGHIRQSDAVAHVVRCFDDPNVSHVLGALDPVRDLQIVETELLLADLQVLERAIEKRERVWQTRPKEYSRERERWLDYRRKLEAGIALRNLEPEARDELKGLGLLTGRPVIYVANVTEPEFLEGDTACLGQLAASEVWAQAAPAPQAVVISAQLEWELSQLEPADRRLFMQDLKMEQTGLQRLVRTAFSSLGLITFYTIANQKLQAWSVPEATPAPRAAAQIHSRMETGFIRAQVVAVEEVKTQTSFAELARAGRVRTEGKDYRIQDGDVVNFLFT